MRCRRKHTASVERFPCESLQSSHLFAPTGIASRKKICAIEAVTGTARDIAIAAAAAAAVGNGKEEISAVAIPLERRITAMAVGVEVAVGQGGGGAQRH